MPTFYTWETGTQVTQGVKDVIPSSLGISAIRQVSKWCRAGIEGSLKTTAHLGFPQSSPCPSEEVPTLRGTNILPVGANLREVQPPLRRPN